MNFSPLIDLLWQIACIETVAAKRQFIDPEQFLAALTKLKQFCDGESLHKVGVKGLDVQFIQFELELIASILQDAGIDPDTLRHELRERVGIGTYEHSKGATVHRSDRSRTLFETAETIAEEMKSKELNAGHLFIAILQEEDSVGCRLLLEKRADLETLMHRTREYLEHRPVKEIAGKPRTDKKVDKKSETPFLDRFGIDLTKEAREGKLGPIIGRRNEILHVIRTLARRSKNNPVLVGEAGVGKTAIVEALAIRIAQGKDAHVLGGKRIVALNMGTLVGDTKYRGEFEKRLSNVIEECRCHPEVILFIDELHTVVGAGGVEGGMDAANILKPALARGDMSCIGATTITEYRRYVESDSALERRFERVFVAEPTRDETVEILQELRPTWEQHHRININNEALEAAVDLSIRFDCDHQLPDKAIDLIDLAGARLQVPELSFKLGMGKPSSEEVEGVKDYSICGEITEHTVAEVLSQKIRVPPEIITGHLEGMSQSRLLHMEEYLKERIIGQDRAVERVCKHLLLAHAALSQRRGPLSVFLFLGPTGVGKTELARCLATFLLGSEKDMIRLDMSEYMEEHSVAKLIGSPPGYVGHEEEGQLTGKLRTKPYSVVLLDEIEKAHPRVFDIFLQVFDEGRLTDSKGRTADARHAVFIMTSNIPADKDFGFRHKDTTESRSFVFHEVERRFRKEFLNRIDQQIAFRPIDISDVKVILHKKLNEISEAVKEKHQRPIHFTEAAVNLIASGGYSEEYGVRNLYRTVERLVEGPIAQLIHSGKLEKWPGVIVAVQDNQVVLQPLSAETL